MASSSGSEMDGSDMGEFLDDFASESDDGEIAAEAADATRAWTKLTAPSESAAAAAVAHAARADARVEGGSDDEQLPWLAEPEPQPEPAPPVGDCAISPLAALVTALDGSAARSILAQCPNLCSPQCQSMLLSLCDGDYLAVLAAGPVRELLGLPVSPQDDGSAGEADSESISGEELRQRGNQLYKDADYTAAAESYSKAARALNGQDKVQGQAGGRELCQLNRAACYLKLGHNLAAIADCNAVLLTQPESVKALFRRGQAFANTGNLPRARTDLTAAAKLSPKDSGVRSALADCKARLKAEDSGSAPPGNELVCIREAIRRIEMHIQRGSPGAASDTSSEPNQIENDMLYLCTAIALLLTFVQANWTAAESPSVTGCKLSHLIHTPGQDIGWAPFNLQLDGDQLHKACLEELSVDGETASVNTQSVQCLLLSNAILKAMTVASSREVGASDLHSAVVWWTGRSMSLHQRLLEDCPSSTLDTAILGSYEHVAEAVAGAGVSFSRKCGCDALNGRDLEALPHLELAVYAYTSGQRPLFRSAIKRASEASGLQWNLDGVLGVRTKYQTQKKAQLVIRHTSERGSSTTSDGTNDSSVQPPQPPQPALFASGCLTSTRTGMNKEQNLPAHVALDDDTLLPEVRLEEDANAEALVLDQAIILLGGMAAQMLETVDETLRNEQLRAFTRLITAQKCSLWCIQATALVQRSKIESHKRRTMPRALEQLRSLVKEAKAAGTSGTSHPYPREAMFFGVPVAPRWSVQRDEALGYCKEGIFELAAEIFLEIQAWHDVIDSYTAANEILKAENIVRTRLAVEPSPRLWCALGELCERSRVGKTPLPNDSDDACSCYKHALSLDPRYGHAHRCLAKLAWSEERFEDVIFHLDAALAINPMSTPSWYTLGCTALRLKRWQKARAAFTRFLAAEPDDGEAYANLAVALIHLKQKDQAYTVLSDAVRHAWGNGKIWQNYVPVCIDTGHFNTAVRAIERLIAMKHEKEAIDIPALRVLITVVESNGEIVDADGVSARRLRLRIQSLLETLQLVDPGKEHVGLHEQVARFHAAAASCAVVRSTADSSPAVSLPDVTAADSDGARTATADGDALLDKELSAAAHHQRRSVSLARQLELISRWPEEQLEDRNALAALATLATTTVDALQLVEKGEETEASGQNSGEGDETISLLKAQVRSAITTIRQHGALITKDGGAECFMVLDEQLGRLV